MEIQNKIKNDGTWYFKIRIENITERTSHFLGRSTPWAKTYLLLRSQSNRLYVCNYVCMCMCVCVCVYVYVYVCMYVYVCELELFEIFRPVRDYKNYSISNFENIKNNITNKILKPAYDKDGYKNKLFA